MIIEAGKKYYTELNREVKAAEDREIIIKGVLGQRYIGTGVKNKDITVYGTPGNAMGAYLSGTNITVYGNVQDAVGDTMDNGDIVVYGNGGDTLGYGMRGGSIYIRDNGGYRVGIHMKAYMEHQPVVVIGGKVGSFLGEYQAEPLWFWGWAWTALFRQAATAARVCTAEQCISAVMCRRQSWHRR